MSFETSSVVITGASRGIGRHIALAFAGNTSHPLILLARSQQGLQHTRDLCLERGASAVEVLPCDLTHNQSVSEITIPDSFPEVGILINNAGSYLYKKLEDTRSDEFREQIETNLFSAVHVTQRFLGDLKKQERGLIINICSVGALEGLEESGAYSSAKHALLGYTRSLRKELLQTKVAVSAVNLGQTQSTSWEGSSINPERLIDPRDVADLLVALSGLSSRTVAEEVILKPRHGRVPPM